MEHAQRRIQVFTTLVICAMCALGAAGDTHTVQFVEKWANGTNYRNSWCDLHAPRIYRGNFIFALEGRNINALASYGDWTGPLDLKLTEEGQVESFYFLDLITEVARRGMFTITTYAALGPGSEGTWSDYLYWSIEHFDITLDWYTPTWERKANQVGFYHPLMDISLNLVTKYADTVTQGLWEQLFWWRKPFSGEVWLSIIGMLMVSSWVYCYLEGSMLADGEKKIGECFTPKTTTGRSFMKVLSWCMLLLGSTYTANLANILINGSSSRVADVDIDKAASQRLPVCVEGGSAESHILKQQYPSIPQVDVMNNDEGLRLVREGRCCAAAMPQFIFDLQKRDFELNGDCAFEFVGRPLTRSGGAFASQTGVSYCTQMVRDVFELILAQMEDEGWTENLYQQALAKQATIEPCEVKEKLSTDDANALTLSNVGGIFLPLFLVAVVCISIRTLPSLNQVATVFMRANHAPTHSYGSSSATSFRSTMDSLVRVTKPSEGNDVQVGNGGTNGDIVLPMEQLQREHQFQHPVYNQHGGTVELRDSAQHGGTVELRNISGDEDMPASHFESSSSAGTSVVGRMQQIESRLYGMETIEWKLGWKLDRIEMIERKLERMEMVESKRDQLMSDIVNIKGL